MLKLETEREKVAFSKVCTKKQLSIMLKNFITENQRLRSIKHMGMKTIKRRNTEQENAYGKNKEILNLLNFAKQAQGYNDQDFVATKAEQEKAVKMKKFLIKKGDELYKKRKKRWG